MPFSDEVSSQAYSHCIKPVCDEFDLEIRRADELFTTNPVYDDIVKEIQEASIIIVDITGRNPNVFYELGIAHTLKQSRTIMLTHEDFEKAPFDVSHFRIIRYKNSIEGTRNLESELKKTLEYLLQDLKTIHRQEFELVTDVLTSNDKFSELFALIGLGNYPGAVNRHDRLNAEGHVESGENSSALHSISIENGLKAYIKMGYVSLKGEQIQVTDMGRAFVEFLSDKGFICDLFNDQIFTDGFIPFYERMKKEQQNSEVIEHKDV